MSASALSRGVSRPCAGPSTAAVVARASPLVTAPHRMAAASARAAAAVAAASASAVWPNPPVRPALGRRDSQCGEDHDGQAEVLRVKLERVRAPVRIPRTAHEVLEEELRDMVPRDGE